MTRKKTSTVPNLDPQIREAAEEMWSAWTSLPEEEKTEKQLTKLAYEFSDLLLELSYERDLDAMARLWDMYRFGEQYFPEEPLRTEYEVGLLYFAEAFAENHFIEGDFSQAVQDEESVLYYLELIDRRRERHGLSRKPYSVLRLSALMTLASCKIEDESLLDEVLNPEQLIRKFWRVANRMFKRIDEIDATERMREDAFMLLAVAELEICKLALKYEPELVSKAIRNFNTHHGSHLTMRPLHFRRRSAIIRNGWYWDFELFKLELSGNAKREDLEYVDQQRRRSARLAFTGFTVLVHNIIWDRQMARLLPARRGKSSKTSA